MKRLGCILALLALSCSPLLAERIVKVEALSTDTTTFRQNKIQLNMTELAVQLAPYVAPGIYVDGSDLVLQGPGAIGGNGVYINDATGVSIGFGQASMGFSEESLSFGIAAGGSIDVSVGGGSEVNVHYAADLLTVVMGVSSTSVLAARADATSIHGCWDYGRLTSSASIGSPAECDKFFDTSTHVPCFYNGTAWKSVIDGTTTCTAVDPE